MPLKTEIPRNSPHYALLYLIVVQVVFVEAPTLQMELPPDEFYDTIASDASNPDTQEHAGFILEYTKEAFVTAWNSIKDQYFIIIDNRPTYNPEEDAARLAQALEEEEEATEEETD